MGDARFLGAGPAFPFETDPGGALTLRRGAQKIEESIRLVLSTRPGERPMRPTFGCRAHEMVFSPSSNPRTLGMVSRAVEEALEMWEPRIDVRGVTAWPDGDDPSVLYVEVDYLVRATNDPRNLVHPFYTIPPETGHEVGEEHR